MPLYRVNFFYAQRGDRSGGWTSNLWNLADDEPTVIGRIKLVGAALQAMSGGGCNIVKARYAVSPGFRIGDEVEFTYDRGLAPAGDVNADYQTTAISLRLLGATSAGKYAVTIWLSGNPDFFVAFAGRLQPGFATSAPFGRFKALVGSGGNGWVMNVKDKGRPKKKVSAIGVNVNGTVTAPNHGFDGSVPVVISRVSGQGRPRGSYAITNITVNTFDLIGYTNPLAAALNVRFAIARPDVYTQVAITDIKPKRATKHDRGRPTDLLSGKQKKAKT